MKYIMRLILLLIVFSVLPGCATNQASPGADAIGSPTPALGNSSYIYNSVTPATMRQAEIQAATARVGGGGGHGGR